MNQIDLEWMQTDMHPALFCVMHHKLMFVSIRWPEIVWAVNV